METIITPQEVEVGDEIHELVPEVHARGTYYTVKYIEIRQMKTCEVYDFYTTSSHHVWVQSTDKVVRRTYIQTPDDPFAGIVDVPTNDGWDA